MGRPLIPLRGKTIGFIGAGTMGQALVAGLRAVGIQGRALLVSDPSAAMRTRVRRLGARTTDCNCEVACDADVIILAVKPQEMAAVLSEIASCVSGRQLLISIAAGITLRWLQARLPRVPMVRVMPNLPATVQRGFAAYALGRRASARHRAITEAVFGSVGEVVELPERLLDAVTAVSGSGPAYLFYLAHIWQEAALAVGLPPAVAQRAIRQTLQGSVSLLTSGEATPQAWMAKVASKKGTTEAALRVLAKRHVARHCAEAVRAAARRSKELSWS